MCATCCTHSHKPTALLSWAAGRRWTQAGSEQVTRGRWAVICQVLDKGVQIEKYRRTWDSALSLDLFGFHKQAFKPMQQKRWICEHGQGASGSYMAEVLLRRSAVLLADSQDHLQLPARQPSVQKEGGLQRSQLHFWLSCKGCMNITKEVQKHMGLNQLVGRASHALITV